MTIAARVLLGVVLVAARSHTARADEEGASPDRQAAQALKAQGDEEARQGNYPLALEHYQRAYRAYQSPNLRFDIALALAALGRDVEALEEFEHFLAEAPDAPADARDHARSRVGELEQRIARLWVADEVAGTEVLLDDHPIGRTPLDHPIRVMPGDHVLTARSPGHRFFTRRLTLAAGAVQHVDIVLVNEGALEHPTTRSDRAGGWTWIAAGTSAALLGAGIVVGVNARSTFEQYMLATTRAQYLELRDRVSTEATVTNVLLAGAGAAAVTAVLLYYWRGRAADPVRSQVQVWAVPSGVVVGVTVMERR